MEIPAINLKAIILVHWLLTMWGTISLPNSFAWGNFGVLAVGIWAVAKKDSIDAILMFLVGMVVTILTDIIHFGIFYPLSDPAKPSVFHFSEGMAIISLLLKPISCFFVYQMYRERGGECIIFGFPAVHSNRDAYQSIDRQDESTSETHPFNHSQDSKAAPRSY